MQVFIFNLPAYVNVTECLESPVTFNFRSNKKDTSTMTTEEIGQLSQLIKTMRQLRSQNGCAWDREQSPESLRPYILEEAYELIDAIDAGDTGEILAELGDLLLQVVFQAQIFSERGLFGIGDVAAGINTKLQRRHPHIFSCEKNSTHADWEQIKQQELQEKGKEVDFASRQPANLPALKLADKCCRHLSKNSTTAAEFLNPERRPEPQMEYPSEESLAEGIFNLVYQAQQLGIDSDLALRKYVLNLLQKADQDGCN
jgi:MazG family protein